MISSIRNKISLLDTHSSEVIKKSVKSSFVKIIGMTAGLLVSIFLGRTLGADGLGIINLSHQITSLLIIICLIGMRQVIVKEVAIGHSRHDTQRIGDVMYTAYWINGLLVFIISIILIFLTPYLSNNIFNEPRLSAPLIIAFSVLTPRVFSRIFSAALNGYRKIWQSNLADQTLSLVITAIIIFLFWLLKIEITIINAAIVFSIGRFAVMITLGLYWRRLYRHRTKNNFIGRELLSTALPLLLVTSIAVIASNASTIILGWLDDSTQVGLYTVAARLALLTSFFLQVTNAAISPKLAALYADNKINEMEKMVQRITKGLGFIGFFQILVFIVFGRMILTLWGTEFADTYWLLIIMSLGQFFNIATGATGMILIMCGYEKIQGRISFIFLIVNLLLNYFLIIHFGAMGAAIATAVSIAGANIAKLVFVKIKVGILIIPFLKL